MAPRDSSVESFLLLLAARRSPRTVDAYRRDLGALAAFADGRVDDVSAEELERWLARMRADGLAPSTLARRAAAVRAYFRHQVLIGAREDNPAAQVALPAGRDECRARSPRARPSA